MRTYDPHAAATLFGADGWFKATASDANGTGCVEVNFARDGWFKATASNANGTGCVEVNFGAGGLVGLRDSKQPGGGAFVFTPGEWRTFLDRATRGAAPLIGLTTDVCGAAAVDTSIGQRAVHWLP